MTDPHMWPRSHHWATYALRNRLLAACVRGEAKQGWVPCRAIRAILGAER